nr:NADH dehydrogenase subunit 1 [Actornithophilus hoplopteri]
MKEYLLLLFSATQFLIMLVFIFLSVAFFSLMERKILSYIHFRKGPNKVIIMGLFQPFVDAIKLITKDDSPVSWSNKALFYLSPIFMLSLSLIIWIVFPFLWGELKTQNFSFLLIFFFLGMSVYGLIISGWSSNSKYAMLGSVRSIVQSISYEVILSFLLLSLMVLVWSYSIHDFGSFKLMKVFLMAPFLFSIFSITALAELNRSPFDLSEGESELVSGYSIEYGGIMYTMIFLSENVMIFFSSLLISYFFFNLSSTFMFFILFSFMSFMICLIRGIVPRLRYDILMYMCWVCLLPLAMVTLNLVWLLSLSAPHPLTFIF